MNSEYEYEIMNKLTDEELKERIKEVLKIENINQINKYNVKIRNEKIKKLNIIKGTSKTQIARVLGVKRGVIFKAMCN